MVYQINGPKGTTAAEKAKAKARAAAGGSSFAAALAEAQAAAAPEAAMPFATNGLTLPAFVPTDDVLNQNTQHQTAVLLKQLRELADAALGGGSRPDLHQLKELAHASAADEQSLTPQQRTVVAEVRTRAAVEAAKQEQ
jgi:hypothetical protein